MYRMLIVEDEEIEREGLRELFDWKSMGVEVVGAVESGEEAILFADEKDFDILFTDIKLTGMTGLELSKLLLDRNPELKIIISSGYRDFEYARTAVSLDAYGYLSKPIEPDELREVVTRVLTTCRKENTEKQEKERLKKLVEESLPFLKNNFLSNLLHRSLDEATIAENLEYFNIAFTGGSYCVLVLETDEPEATSDRLDRDERFMKVFMVQETINAYKTDCTVVSFHIYENRYGLLVNMETEPPKRLHERLLTFAAGLQKRINDNCGLHATIGIGMVCESLTGLASSYHEAVKAVEYKFYMGSNQIIVHTDITFEDRMEGVRDTEELCRKIIASLEICDRKTLNEKLGQLFDQMKNRQRYSDAMVRNICIDLLAKASIMLMEIHESYDRIFGKETLIWEKITRFDNLFDIRQWMKNIFNAVIDYLMERREGNNKKIINEILKNIAENYGKNLTIVDIANDIYLSPNYVSIIFKKEMGESFTDYLVKYRLDKAGKMLKETNLKVYQIGNMVGYSNISYFCSIFKNSYGVNPSDYRDKA